MSISDRLSVLYVGLMVIFALTDNPGIKKAMELWLVCLLPLILLFDALSAFLKK